MNNITLGKYVPYNSLIHKLDPRFKIFAMILLMVGVFLSFSSIWMNFIVYGLLLAFIITIMFISHVKLSSLFKQLKFMWFMILFLLIINMMVPGNPDLGFIQITSSWKIYFSAIYNTLYIAIRLVIMLAISLVLTSTTTPLELTGALEWYMYPLRVFHFPASEIAMMLSIALRFIPTLLDDADRIMKAQSSRGVDFKHGKLKEKIVGITSLIIPLFVSSFIRSDELASAMECRGYDPREKRSRYRVYKFYFGDILSIIFVIALVALIMTISITKFDIFGFFGVNAL